MQQRRPGCGQRDPRGFEQLAGFALGESQIRRANLGQLACHPQEIIDSLDRMNVSDRPSDLIASVRPDALVLTDNVQEVVLDMPDDVTYLSIAPYIEQTHECFFHSLTTCRGELSGQDIEVRIVDDATGDVIVTESTTTFDNGFAGFWVPRDLQGTIEVTYNGRSGTTPFSTADEKATCITTLQLM